MSDADRISQLERQVAKLTEINRALMGRVERSLDFHGNAFSLFEAAIFLDRKVNDRTRELTEAMRSLETTNNELNAAIIASHTAQNRLHDAINSMSEGFALFDRDDRLILFNQKFLDYWPSQRDRVRASITYHELLTQGFRHGDIAMVQELAADWIKSRLAERQQVRRGQPARSIYALRDGRWVQMNDRLSAEGGIASVLTDITDLKRAEHEMREQALAERSLHLQATIESMSLGVAVFEAGGMLVHANERFWRLLDLPPVFAMPGATFDEFKAYNERRGSTALVPEVGTGSDECSWMGRWFSIKRDRMPDGGFVCTFADVTTRKEAEVALRDSERRIRLVTDAMPAMICYVDAGLIYRFTNRPYRETFGRGHDPLGLHVAQILAPADFATRKGHMDQALSGRFTTFELMLPGQGRFGIATYVPHIADDGAVIGFFTLIQDITERRRAEKLLAEANEMLERRVAERTATLVTLNETLRNEISERERVSIELQQAKLDAERANVSKTKFLADASHDLLQPLNAARLFVSSLTDQALPVPSAGLIRKLDNSLTAVEELLGTLLDISKFDAGRVTIEEQVVALSPILNGLLDEMGPVARARGLDLRLVPATLSVRTDPRLFRRILQNLLSNAIRYTPKGRILLGVRRGRHHARIFVHDTGVGIPADRMEEIFEEFRRLDQPNGMVNGFGLGLSIVRRIARLLGHRIKVRSTLGRGSAFSIELPIATTRPVERPAVPVPAVTPVARIGTRVLVIDNEQAILDGMRSLLEGWSCEVAVARGVRDAIDSINGHPPDIVLADYHLDRGETGIEAIGALRRRLGGAVPAALLTADRSVELQRNVSAMERCALLYKPVKPAKLRALMTALLDG
ncbi:hybrid sensor histidine kinase/response regulator [Zavarzinia compransoris]|uniref:histidine kinase n=1 Tax=Zavarzinia compransoris TaxID=1264899 RepID=A0A317E509_9PROT|nr:PAS domain-containing hybrid sensor histidine kinase/response regulator [Zavarzinia compransoris]PWR22218.1 hybrid sensor histidine kinase/response regulator [Zavarzinia compransoris]TDP47028.1 PAS domain S-box-containing protein [Zavarzinia compransoris]